MIEHFEYCYLVHRAHEVKRMAERAKAEGEEFHVSNAFSPLANYLMAHVVIRSISPGEPEVIILRLRHPDDGQDWLPKVRATQGKFFEPGYVEVPGVVREDGLVEHLAYSDKVPAPLKPPTP